MEQEKIESSAPADSNNKQLLSHQLLRLLFTLSAEFLILYSFLVIGLLTEFWLGIISPGRAEFDVRYLGVAFSHSAQVLIPVFIIYAVARRGFVGAIEKTLKSKKIFGNAFSDILVDIYFIAAGVLMYAPIKPVLQDTRVVDSFYITEVFVKYDFVPTLIILSVIALLPILFLLKEKNSALKFIKIGIVICFIFLAGILNKSPNFNARIFETRAAWKSESPEVLFARAKLALEAARTAEERSSAYYWMGVGSNLMEQPLKAIEYQNLAILEDPKNGTAYSSLAYAYLRLSKPVEMKQAAESCIEKEPDYSWCYMAMGEYYLSQSDFKNGYGMFMKATELDPDSPEIVDGLNNVTKYMRENNITIP